MSRNDGTLTQKTRSDSQTPMLGLALCICRPPTLYDLQADDRPLVESMAKKGKEERPDDVGYPPELGRQQPWPCWLTRILAEAPVEQTVDGTVDK